MKMESNKRYHLTGVCRYEGGKEKDYTLSFYTKDQLDEAMEGRHDECIFQDPNPGRKLMIRKDTYAKGCETFTVEYTDSDKTRGLQSVTVTGSKL
jgi:hypothetical protein